MSPGMNKFSALLLSFFAAAAPCYALNQEIHAEFAQAAAPYEEVVEQAPYCDADCMIDIAEAGAILMKAYDRKEIKRYALPPVKISHNITT